jgi:hypothetical protein
MNHTEKLNLLAEWQAHTETANRLIDPITEVLGLSVESPIHTAVWGLQTAYTKAVSKLVGDGGEWLDWYASENDFGRKHMEAGPKDATRHISTLADLVWVMEVTA